MSTTVSDERAAPKSSVDVVVVSYNSRDTLRGCVENLAGAPHLAVYVVDNASTDGSTDTVADLDVVVLTRHDNRGFSAGCNHGWRAGSSPYVLFLNPDARIERAAIDTLVEAIGAPGTRAGIVAPKILSAGRTLEYSQRRFPALRSTFAQALFLHRLFDRAAWTDEVIRDPEAYDVPGSPDWVSGACLLVRRELLELLDGWDESFFLYSEDTDLCRRARSADFDVRYEPEAIVVHIGGQSSPRAGLLPLLAESRIRYADKHSRGIPRLLQRAGIALSALTHAMAARTSSARAGHARALATALRLQR
jgi:N-acetylglucosaminyl-diphospho-decaprenol L-rhamnosyltransferase